jgi:hypothetical protein
LIDPNILLVPCLVITALTLLASQILRKIKGYEFSSFREIIAPISSIGAIVFLANNIFGILIQDKARSYLYSNLQWGGIAVLLIGFLYAADSSRLAIIKLFPPTEKLDQQTQQRIIRMSDIGLSPDQIMKIEQVSISQLQNVVVISNETNVVKSELAETTKQALEEGQQP